MKSKEIKAYVGADMLGVVDRLFQGDMFSIVTELAQNARRAGASSLEITRSVMPNGASRMELRDDGVGIADPQILLGLRDSAWQSPDVADEDPAGMGFFVLSGCPRAGVSSLDWRIENLSPGVFLGKESATVEYDQPHVSGTVVWFELSSSQTCLLGEQGLRRFLSLCGLRVKLDGRDIPIRKFGAYNQDEHRRNEFAVTGAFEDLGVTYTCACKVSDNVGNARQFYNFFGFEGSFDIGRVLGLDRWSPAGAGCWIHVDIHHAKALKPVLPARKELVHNAALVDLCRRLDRVAFSAVNSRSHFLPFEAYDYAMSIGVAMNPASACLVPVDDGEPFRYGADFIYHHGKGVRHETHARVPWAPRENNAPRTSVLLVRWLDDIRWNPGDLPVTLVWDRSCYKGYKWYDALPVCHIFQCVGNQVIAGDEDPEEAVTELEKVGYSVVPWADCEFADLGDTKVVAVVIDPAGRVTVSEQQIPAVINPEQDREDYYGGAMRDNICVASEGFDVGTVVEWITDAVKPEEFEDYESDVDAEEARDRWDNDCLADIRLRLQTPHDARKDVFRRFLDAAKSALQSNAVVGLNVEQCAVRLARGHNGAAWDGRWRLAGSEPAKPGPRIIVVEQTVNRRTVVAVADSVNLGDAMHRAKKAAEGGFTHWESEVEDTIAFEQGTEWTRI